MQVRVSSAINMFSNSKMSEIDPRGGVSIFQSPKFKKNQKYPIGGVGVVKAIWDIVPNFPVVKS